MFNVKMWTVSTKYNKKSIKMQSKYFTEQYFHQDLLNMCIIYVLKLIISHS